jgi:hypothetical protein
MDLMLDAGFCLPAIGFAIRRGGREYSILKGSYSFFQHPVSSILPIVTSIIVFTILSFLIPT